MEELSVQKSQEPIVTIDDHEENMLLSIQLSRLILRPIGAWPKPSEIPFAERCAYVLVNVSCVCLIISFLFVPCAAYLVLEGEDTYNTLKLSGPLNFCLMAITKYSSLICRENDIRKCVEYIENDWINTQHRTDRTIMMRNAKFGRRLIAFCAIFMYGGLVFYYFVLPIKDGKIVEDGGNLTYRRLVYPVAKAIVDARQNPINEIIFWMQLLSGFVVHSITAGSCSLAATFAIHAYGRLEVLMNWIDHLVDGREDFCDSVDKRLAMIVQQHLRILSFISLTDKVLREICIVDIAGCTLSMCFLGYYVIVEWGNKTNIVTYIILLTSLTFNIFIFCYIGELVAGQCKKIGEVSYMIDWYRLPGKRGLSVTLINSMSNSSVKLTVANFIELSLATFGDVVRTSVGYLNMLRTLTM